MIQSEIPMKGMRAIGERRSAVACEEIEDHTRRFDGRP